jgi:hypothetical protein
MKITRAKRIQKLANAIKRFRGKYRTDRETGEIKWIQAPIRDAEADCLRWMDSLGVTDLPTAMKQITEFKSFPEFRTWMQETFPN